MKLVISNGEVESYLGITPTCDICKERIKSGDDVIQTFIGTVKPDKSREDLDLGFGEELGIVTRTYQLVHITCFKDERWREYVQHKLNCAREIMRHADDSAKCLSEPCTCGLDEILCGRQVHSR
jgi:hypothetical protein